MIGSRVHDSSKKFNVQRSRILTTRVLHGEHQCSCLVEKRESLRRVVAGRAVKEGTMLQPPALCEQRQVGQNDNTSTRVWLLQETRKEKERKAWTCRWGSRKSSTLTWSPLTT